VGWYFLHKRERADGIFSPPQKIDASEGSVAPDPSSTAHPEVLKTQEFRREMGTVSRHSAVFFAGTIFTAALSYLFKVYLARTLDARALGIYALGMTLVAFLSLFNSLGLPRSASRYVAAYCATERFDLLRGFLARSLLVLLVFNVLLGAVMLLAGPWIAVHFYHTPQMQAYLPLFALLMVAGVLSSFFGQVLAAYKNVAGRTMINNFIGTPARMALTVVLIAAGFGLGGYIFAQMAGAFLVLALLIRMAWRLTPQAARSTSGTLPGMERGAMAFAAASVGLGLLDFMKVQTDSIAVGHYLDARRLGVYSIAATMVAMVSLVQRSVNQIFASTIADLHARGEHHLLKRMFQTVTKWVVGLTFPFGLVLIIYAREIMQIFGRGFEEAWPILIIGGVAGLVDCGVGSAGTLLLMSGRQNRLIKIQVVTAGLMIGLSLALVPRWGIIGAGLATALNVALTNLWFLVEVRRELKFYPYSGSFWRLAAPLACMVVVLLLVHSAFPMRPVWAGIAVGMVLAYGVFAGIALVASFDEDDWVIARAAWSRLPRLGGPLG
jgi:O-antigen/teichoic acid export membrane protein